MLNKNVQHQPPDLSYFLLSPKDIPHTDCSPGLKWEGAWGSGQLPSCSMVPLRVQSPPGPGLGVIC